MPSSISAIYALLHGYPLMGDLMSYQTAIDLNYSALTGFGENEFTQPGPGAQPSAPSWPGTGPPSAR